MSPVENLQALILKEEGRTDSDTLLSFLTQQMLGETHEREAPPF